MALLPVLAALVVVAAACASSTPKAAPPSTTLPPPPVSITPSPANGAQGVALNAPLALWVRNGTIASVVVRSATGPGPTGKVSSTGNAWVAAGNFVPNTAYAAVAKITDTRGHSVTRRLALRHRRSGHGPPHHAQRGRRRLSTASACRSSSP